MTTKHILLALIALGLSSMHARAELHNRGNGLIYDSTLNVTWLADMNYAKTSGFDVDGTLTWSAATNWVADLDYAGYSDWRLPTLLENDPTCDGAFDSDMTRTTPGASSRGGCTGGELSHLFVVSLGNKPGESVRTAAGDTSIQIKNQKLFSNIEEALYWSSTRRSDFPLAGWAFATNLGHQWNNRNLSGAHYTLVVRTGDVAAVPEPASYSLLALGLMTMSIPGGLRRRI